MHYKHAVTIHHKLSQSWWGNSLPQNLVNLRDNVHVALHTLMDDKTPIQQQRRLLELNKSVLHPDVYVALDSTLKKFEWVMEINAYNPLLFDSDKFLKKHKHAK